MRVSSAAACVVLLGLLSSSGGAPAAPVGVAPDAGLGVRPSEIQAWVRDRAREFDAEERPLLNAAPLWSERPKGLLLPATFEPPRSLAPLIRAVSPGVVNISAYTDEGEERSSSLSDDKAQAVGSGFILGAQGYVVTNYHVVDKARRIRVKLSDDREFVASVVGMDASTDLALLKLTGDRLQNLPYVYLGDSDRLEVGEWVVAIGNPLGFDHSVSHGMISAKERTLGVGPYDDFIQTDVLMNPGNSGGPLFNMRGEVVGVNTAVVSHAQGIGFAVPINMVKDLLPNLRANGRLARGWLGLQVVAMDTPNAAERKQVVVKEVYAGGPAMAAGIHEGDRIIAVNGRAVESFAQLLRKVSLTAPGTPMRFTLMRGGLPRDMALTVVERPAEDTALSVNDFGRMEHEGLALQDVDGAVAQTLHVPPYHGVLVSEVVPNGPAARAGLHAGDLITEVDHHSVEDIHSLRELLDRSGGRRTVVLRVEHGQETHTVALSPRTGAQRPPAR